MARRSLAAQAAVALVLAACSAPAVVRQGRGTYARSPCGVVDVLPPNLPKERVRAVAFLDRLLKASVRTGIFLEEVERNELGQSDDLPILFWTELTFAIPTNHRDFEQSGAGADVTLGTAIYRGLPVRYFEIIEDNPVPGGYKFTRVLAQAFPEGYLRGETHEYCVIERREGVLRRRTVFEYWRNDLSGDYFKRPEGIESLDASGSSDHEPEAPSTVDELNN